MSSVLQGGIIPAPVMPFREDASPDWPVLERYVGQMAQAGINALAINMAAAEATALEPTEQTEALERAKAAEIEPYA